MDQANLPRDAIGYINFPSFLIGTPVIDTNQFKLAIPGVHDPHDGAKRRFGWAAVKASQSNCSPFAVIFPSKFGPYQLAFPTQVLRGFTGSLRWATRGASITGAIRNISGIQRRAAQVMNSGRFISVLFLLLKSKK